jgi:hypothetical protein
MPKAIWACPNITNSDCDLANCHGEAERTPGSAVVRRPAGFRTSCPEAQAGHFKSNLRDIEFNLFEALICAAREFFDGEVADSFAEKLTC